MTKSGHHSSRIILLIFILVFVLPTSWEIWGTAAQSRPKTAASAMNPEKLPDILAEGASKLERDIAALREKNESAKQALESLVKETAQLQARGAALNASMAVGELTLAGAEDAVKNLKRDEDHINTRLKEFTREQTVLEQTIQERAAALLSIKDLMAELDKTDHPLHDSKELQKAYRAYQQLGREYDAEAKIYQETLAKSEDNLRNSMKQVTETRSKLEEDYLEKALKQELLKRQTPQHLLVEIRQVVLTLVALPGKAYTWMVEMSRSGVLLSFVADNWTKLSGLLLLLVLVGAAAIRLEKLMRPSLAVLPERVTEVGLRVLLAIVSILSGSLFSFGFVAWLYVAFWSLQLNSHKAGWLIWCLTASLVVLRMVRKVLKRCLAGEEAGGVLPIPGDMARFYRWHFSLMAIVVVLVRLFLLPNSALLGFTPEGANSLRSYYQVVLLGWVLWLMRKKHLDPFLAFLPVPSLVKSKAFLRALRITALLVFAFVVVAGLLGMKFLSEYTAQGASFTLAVLVLAWVFGEVAHTLLRLTLHPEMGLLARRFPERAPLFLNSYQGLTRTVGAVLAGVALLVTLKVWGIPPAWLAWAFNWLNWGPSFGPLQLTPLSIGLAVLLVYLGFWLSRVLRKFLELKFFPSRDWDEGIKYTVSMSMHYVILVLTALTALNALGLSMTNLALVAGGLGVGIGFGLQNIVSNFLSGLILLFERPIKVGDMLVIDGQWGMVKEIRVRSTIFQTFDRYFLIIPNSDLISGKILNWTYGGWGLNRLALKVGVSYSSEPLQVTRILEEVCRANPRVVDDPPPQIFFEAYGDSSLNFNIWVFLATPGDRIPATHELNSAIFEAFQRHGIEIPFPQRDLHVRSWSHEAVPPMPDVAKSGAK